MQEIYPLLVIGLIWTIVAVIQDLKTREVSNWLNFSLIIFALGYRASYSIINKDSTFFLYGLLWFIRFFALAHLFYYIQAFAGGDAKLLMGFGAILPFNSLYSLMSLTLIFILILFIAGAAYSLIYSVGLSINRSKKFKKNWSKFTDTYFKHWTYSVFAFFALSFITYALLKPKSLTLLFFLAFILLIFPILFIYIKALDKAMIVLLSPSRLTEGDWLEKAVTLPNKHHIKKSVHGLSGKEIALLKKYNKSVLIKEGIPFTPSFLIALLIITLLALTNHLTLNYLLNLLGFIY